MMNHLPPGPLERAFRAAAYLATALIGLSVILDPPMMHSLLGSTLTFVWALFILSALPCVWAALAARYRVEYILLPFFTTALMVSVIALWYKYGTGEITFTLPRVLAATALVFVFAARFVSLQRIVNTQTGAPTWMQRLFRHSRH